MNTTELRADALTARAIAGDRRAIARLLTRFDDAGPAHDNAAAVLAAHAGRAHVVGITGVPGSGKSTLVNALLGAWLGRGERIAVIAVDPSSPVSGGAVLGDRVRMGEHAAHPNVYIRSFSARGELGGLSRPTRAAVDCFDAAGFDRVIVETVGAGQSETAIAALADTRIVLCAPGLGDDVQAIKAGVLEIADVLAVSKGDLPLAQETMREMREMLTLRRLVPSVEWRPRVVAVRAREAGGIEALLEAIEAHRAAEGPGRRLRAPSTGTPGHASHAVLQPKGSEGRDPPHQAVADRAVTPPEDDADAWRDRLAALAANDGLCATLGIAVEGGGPGSATVVMTVGPQHLNFNGGCHGGSIFALADSAFGLASNSHGPIASGIDAHLTFQAGVRLGDRLRAHAVEVRRARRIAFYRVEVVKLGEAGETPVSTFTGTVYVSG
jgi:LAO/AO transport system ATPase/phenylacetic acid degradation protein PaaD